MNGPNRIKVIKPSGPPPAPPMQPCQQARTDPHKGPVARAVEKLRKKAGIGPSSIMMEINERKKKTIINIQPTVPTSNWCNPEWSGPPPVPMTPSSPPAPYHCPMKMPPIKPQLGPKPGDLVVLQQFFGIRTPLDVEGARRLACSSNIDGSTPLHQAARESRAKEMAALIRMGAPVDAKDSLGFQPVHKAAAAGSVQALKLLKFVGGDLEAEGNHGYKPIHRAAMNGGMEAVRWLVEQGCPVDATISGGWTALHLAVWWDREPVVRCLLEKGASVNYMTNHGLTPLSLAISGQHEHLARIIIGHGGIVE
ncbi:26S proteasome non-ATPase regulatory subunit 10-like [Halyomorpha halys]|uniref:26S proteasome non-ATPase regulatory subunit 10-like n=1 Tax=Halyomorpha halys TaxID=286706 RepID=UPI0006D4D94D